MQAISLAASSHCAGGEAVFFGARRPAMAMRFSLISSASTMNGAPLAASRRATSSADRKPS